ncbi:MAG: putative ABC transporter-binding protein [Puniceicoccaceae bacterium MED-G32]|nr:MAG: putative ABC transporter-binding protein [Puniceicoccaceae bacterium MED-G32]
MPLSFSQYIQSITLSSVLLLSLLNLGCERAINYERTQHPLPEGVDISECESGRYGGIFILNETTQPTTFNPLVPNNLSTSMVLSRLLSNLVEFNPKTELFEPALAESWIVSEDGLTYTFNLRKGLLWSDGQPFTAEDVIFTFDCILSEIIDEATGDKRPRYPSRYYQQLHIDGTPIQYTLIDAHTIRFDLPTTYAPFLYDIGLAILPKHILGDAFNSGSFMKEWTTQTAIETPEEIVGLGPFKIFSYKPGERIVLEPNPHYWRADSSGQRLPYLDYLVIKFVSEANTAIAHFATGKSDASGVGADDYEWVKKAADIYDFSISNRGPSSSVNFFWFNLNPESSEDGFPYIEPYKFAWFSDKRFRKAILHGFNRKGIIDAVLFGKGEPLHSIIPPAQGEWHNPNVTKYAYSAERARELLQSIGFTWNSEGQLFDGSGNRVSFNLLLVESANYDQIGITFVENMKDLGIEVRLERADFATLLKRTDNTFDYDMTILGWGSSSAAYDPSGSKALYLSSGKYHMWYPNQKSPATEWEARIDTLIKLQEQTLDRKQRIAYMHEVQAILSDELPLLFGYSPYSYVGIKDKWMNVYIPKSGTILWNIDEIWEGDGQP